MDDASPLEATPNVLEAFEKLKQTLLSAPILQISNWEKPFLIFMDRLKKKSRFNISTVR